MSDSEGALCQEGEKAGYAARLKVAVFSTLQIFTHIAESRSSEKQATNKGSGSFI